MASPQLERTDADRLRSQAAALRRRGLQLCQEGEDLKRDALELAMEADRLEIVPVTVKRDAPVTVPSGDDVARDASFTARVAELLAGGGMTIRQVAEHLNTSRMRVRGALGRLEEAGAVYRSGYGSGTRYHGVEPDPVRTGTATLHVFTKTTPARELEDREVAWTTEAPAEVGALPERDDG